MKQSHLSLWRLPFRGLIVVVLCSLTMLDDVHAQELQVLRVVDGVRSILWYDQLILRDGTEKKISPSWTTEQNLSRPLKGNFDGTVRCVDYLRADEKGRLGITVKEIKTITLWEKLAMQDLQLCVTQERDDDAQYLLAEIEKFNPEWERQTRLGFSRQLRLKQALRLCKTNPAGNGFERGLAMLDDLWREAPETPRLGASIVALLLPLAEKQYDEQRYAECRDFIERILKADAKSDKALRLRARMKNDAEELLARAESAAKDRRGRDASILALKAQQIRPDDKAVQQRAKAIFKTHQVLKVACYEDAVALDPFNARQLAEKQVQTLLFDPLVETDESGTRFFNGPLVKTSNPIPGFQRQPDGSFAIKYAFELQRDVRYSDGTPVTAADVEGMVRGLQDPRAAAYDSELARLLIGVEVKGPFEFLLLTRQHPFPESFFNFPILPVGSTVTIPKRGDTSSRKPVGSGPFVVAAVAGATDALRLEANTKFRSTGQPYIQEITFPRYQKKGEGHAENDLETGRIHLISDPSPLQLMRLQNAGQEFQSRPLLSNSVWILAINHRRKWLKDRDLRRALLLAIDREAILKQHFAGRPAGGANGHMLVTGPFPPHSPANDPTIKDVKAQPVVAKKLLGKVLPSAEAPTFTLKYPRTDLAVELAMNQIKRDLVEAGFKIQLDPKLPNDMIHEVADSHDFDLAYWRIDHDNILFNVAALFDPSTMALAEGGSNFFGYAPQKLTQLFVDLRNEQVGDRIWQIQHHIHRLLVDDVVMIPLWKLDNYVVYTNRLRGKAPDGKAVDLPISRSTIFRRTEDWWLEPQR